MPVLEINRQTVTQTAAICRYLAREAGLCGKDNWEDLRIDQIVDVNTDFVREFTKYYYEFDEKKKESLKRPLFNTIAPFYMKKFDALIKENEGYLANKEMSWADLYFTALSDGISHMNGSEITDGYSNVKRLQEIVNSLPQIKAWLAKRPADDFSFEDVLFAAANKK
ncbi:glutathione S-transferase-like [Homalodisca vitripennis]|uniref:glutathione S-transferase-like n=1 Tax=Homalodisca vitripennis TaxID=197043 RepID=UPI001EEC3431|nr:glutathione S-transferase-like [Homalodisca vitripennis]